MNEIVLDQKSECAVEMAQDLRVDTIKALPVSAKIELIRQEDAITEEMLDDLIYDSSLTLAVIEDYQGY